jgi:hypothetical protein
MANGRRFSISFVDAKESAGRMRQYSDPDPAKSPRRPSSLAQKTRTG